MRPQPDPRASRVPAPICANCRFLEEHLNAEERSPLRSWCRVWRLMIPDPLHTGCTEFQPKEGPVEEPSNR